jgi:ubiquinone/menaquinone biosynthesis C-methylase UbiE
MKRLIKDLCPPIFWRTLQNIKQAAHSRKISSDGHAQDLDVYWDAEMAEVLETWGEGNAWLEIQFLMNGCRGSVLDIACGTGKVMALLQKNFSNEISISGCDISDMLIDKALERGLDPNVLTVCDATKLPYQNFQFDYSYSIGSLEHFTESGIELAIAEMARVTKVASFHMMPTSRSQLNEGWLKTYHELT